MAESWSTAARLQNCKAFEWLRGTTREAVDQEVVEGYRQQTAGESVMFPMPEGRGNMGVLRTGGVRQAKRVRSGRDPGCARFDRLKCTSNVSHLDRPRSRTLPLEHRWLPIKNVGRPQKAFAMPMFKPRRTGLQLQPAACHGPSLQHQMPAAGEPYSTDSASRPPSSLLDPFFHFTSTIVGSPSSRSPSRLFTSRAKSRCLDSQTASPTEEPVCSLADGQRCDTNSQAPTRWRRAAVKQVILRRGGVLGTPNRIRLSSSPSRPRDTRVSRRLDRRSNEICQAIACGLPPAADRHTLACRLTSRAVRCSVIETACGREFCRRACRLCRRRAV